MPDRPEDTAAHYEDAPDRLAFDGQEVRGFLTVTPGSMDDGIGITRVRRTTFTMLTETAPAINGDDRVRVNDELYTAVRAAEPFMDRVECELELEGPLSE